VSARKPLIAVIGDGQVPRGSAEAELAEELGRRLVESGFRLLTGGLGGVMEAASRGARGSPSFQPGDTVGLLPGFDPADANPWVDVAIATGLDHLRNGLVASADAVVAVGGGAGTLAELCHAWILKRMVIAFRVAGWSGRVADAPLDPVPRYPDIPDDRIYGVDSPVEVTALLRERLALYGNRSPSRK